MTTTDYVNCCAVAIENLKNERTKVLRECEDKLEDIDKRILYLQEQINKTRYLQEHIMQKETNNA